MHASARLPKRIAPRTTGSSGSPGGTATAASMQSSIVEASRQGGGRDDGGNGARPHRGHDDTDAQQPEPAAIADSSTTIKSTEIITANTNNRTASSAADTSSIGGHSQDNNSYHGAASQTSAQIVPGQMQPPYYNNPAASGMHLSQQPPPPAQSPNPSTAGGPPPSSSGSVFGGDPPTGNASNGASHAHGGNPHHLHYPSQVGKTCQLPPRIILMIVMQGRTPPIPVSSHVKMHQRCWQMLRNPNCTTRTTTIRRRRTVPTRTEFPLLSVEQDAPPVELMSTMFMEDDNRSLGQTVASSTYGEDRQKVVNQPLLDPCGDEGACTLVFVLRMTSMPHGLGRMIYEEDGRVYEGDWRHGRWQVQPSKLLQWRQLRGRVQVRSTARPRRVSLARRPRLRWHVQRRQAPRQRKVHLA
mmetsp:Transcript_4145/g.11824  ORF Transcript_4145/g.11824 Transcript_4145/m.11824 type:complete len:413 (-) Transcript_4145:307-1545(-)